MGSRPAPEAIAVAEAFRHLHIDVDVEGASVHHAATGELISIRLEEPDPRSGPQIVVRDRVTPGARRQFQAAGIGWLDLGGHLSFHSPALVVEADVPGQPTGTSQRRASVLGGAVVAGCTMAALASWPQPLTGVRSTARTLGATPGGVSLALKRLIAAGYLTSDHRATSELFWAAAAEWRPDWVELPIGALPPGFDAVAVGALAASKLGAPVAVSVDAKPEYLVSSDAALRYAALSTKTHSSTEPLAQYSVAPAAIAIEQRDPAGETVNDVFVASSAIVALSLAIDPAWGAETVRSWEGDHVWN
ncbi:MAG: hypothetical protein ACR2MB_00775 [Acidimicrobiales bacterium]